MRRRAALWRGIPYRARQCLPSLWRLALVAAVGVTLGVSGCGKEKTSPGPDLTPPNAITDLQAISPTPTSIQLSWTAPGDDGTSGTASQYDIRYSTKPFTESDWDTMTNRSDAPSPQVSGTREILVVTGFSAASAYYFGLKTSDDALNWSDLSNIMSCMPTAYSVDTTWGGSGGGPGQFALSRGLGVSQAGIVYVADTFNNRIQKFEMDGTLLAVWDSLDIDVGELGNPDGVAVDGFGNVYVADTGHNRILKLTSEGDLIREWRGEGSGEGEFYNPQAVAADGLGKVYVVDTNNHRIQKFGATGRFVTMWGGYGSGDGEFSYPRGAATDGEGNVYVADTGNNRVQKFTGHGDFVTKWGKLGSGDGEFDYPRRIAITTSGRIYVADSNNNRIQEFIVEGDSVVFVAKWGGDGADDGEFDQPNDIGVDDAGLVYVLDTSNHRVQTFRLTR